jgi:hypothetical protein
MQIMLAAEVEDGMALVQLELVLQSSQEAGRGFSSSMQSTVAVVWEEPAVRMLERLNLGAGEEGAAMQLASLRQMAVLHCTAVVVEE